MEIVRKLKTDNSTFRMKLTWNSNDFHLLLVKDSEAFECLVFINEKACAFEIIIVNLQVAHDYIRNQSEAVGINEQQYSEKLLKYFCDTSDDIKFNLTESSFSVYRIVNGLKIRYFSSQLNKVCN